MMATVNWHIVAGIIGIGMLALTVYFIVQEVRRDRQEKAARRARFWRDAQ